MDVDLDNLSVLAPAKRLAEQALTELLSPDPTVRNAALEALRPRDEDYGQVFSPEVADGVKQATETAWQRLSPPRVGPRTQLQLGCTLAEHINQSGAFPGGFSTPFSGGRRGPPENTGRTPQTPHQKGVDFPVDLP